MVNTVISLFAGCGGSSLGYQQAGFKELLSIDWNKNSEEVFKLNFPEIPFWNKDICKVTGNSILDFLNIKKGDLDILDGSPPCQGFSTAGARKISDSRNTLFKEFIRLVIELEPKVFIMENVSGMIKGSMKGFFLNILKELQLLNYNVKCKQLNAVNYGVPQSRERIFFVRVHKKLNKNPVFPIPTKKIITTSEAFQNLINTKEDLKFTKITNPNIYLNYNKIQWGKSYQYLFKTKYFNTKKIHPLKPSLTITKTRGLLHYSQPRYLTIKELKRLSSFPDDFKFIGSETNKWARIGNAVMPNQMQSIAEIIKKEILNA